MSIPSATTVPPAQPLAPGARRGRRIAQTLFFASLVWIIVSGSAQILAEGLFAGRVPRDATACRAEIALLRARLADASLASASLETSGSGSQALQAPSEVAAVTAFRTSLGGEAGRAWDIRAQELIDGCPATESSAAYALARLRAAHEAMVRIDAQEVAPARAAHRRAQLSNPVTSPSP